VADSIEIMIISDKRMAINRLTFSPLIQTTRFEGFLTAVREEKVRN